MYMIRHQAESQYPMTESFNTFLHKKVKSVSVFIIEEHILACVTTKDYMIKRTGIIYAWFTCHVCSVSPSCSLSSLTPFSFHFLYDPIFFCMLMAGFSLRAIGRRLGRDHTSIMREINRNRPTYADDAVYWYYATQPIAEERRHKARSHHRQNHQPLVEYVEDKLRLDWPPEAIAARLRLEYPGDERMRISHETIYRWVYLDTSQAGDLNTHLRRRHKKRRRQTRYGTGRRYIPGRVSIDQRPAIVGTRERFGDWEGDTMEGGKGCLATHVERKSRYLVAAKLMDKKAATMNAQSIKAFWRMVNSHCQTIANGTIQHL